MHSLRLSIYTRRCKVCGFTVKNSNPLQKSNFRISTKMFDNIMSVNFSSCFDLLSITFQMRLLKYTCKGRLMLFRKQLIIAIELPQRLKQTHYVSQNSYPI